MGEVSVALVVHDERQFYIITLFIHNIRIGAAIVNNIRDSK